MGSRELTGRMTRLALRRAAWTLSALQAGSTAALLLGGAGAARSQTILLEVSETTGGLGGAVGVDDIDGDGVPDILGAAPSYSPPGISNAGRARVYSGATGGVLLEWVGTQPDGFLGAFPARRGDANADGVPDLMFVAYIPFPQGSVRVMSGSDGALILTYPGYVSAAVGDTNGDGVEEVLTGNAGYVPPGSTSDFGQAILNDGASGATLFTWIGTPVSGYGWDVDGAGDLTGDGVPDLVVSALGYGVVGAVQVLSGADGSSVNVFTAIQIDSQFGYSVAGPGDLNGDGAGEIAVGVPNFSWGGIGYRGEVRVYSGSTGALLWEQYGSAEQEHLGISVSRVGDVDADGRPDYVAGGPGIPAFPVSRAYVFSGRWGSPIFKAVEGPPYTGLGSGVAWVGDLNGDGFDDFLVDRPYATPPSFRVYSGAPAGVTPFGNGCAAPSGWTPRIGAARLMFATGTPPLRLHLSNVPPGTGAVLLLGLSNTQWWGVPLPLDIAFAGLAGCTLLVSPDLAFPVLATASGPSGGTGPLAGYAQVTFPVPLTPSTIGVHTYFQWLAADPSVPGGSAALTRALEFVIQ